MTKPGIVARTIQLIMVVSASCAVLTSSSAQLHIDANKDMVKVEVRGPDVQVTINGKLFTRYTMECAPNKPVFYPILTEDGKSYTRRWPVEPNAVPGESHDHVHHRGMWFTHSNVNGIDFWSEEGKNIGKTITTRVSGTGSGNGGGSFHTESEWRGPDGQLIATDKRDIVIITLPNGGRVLDFSIRIDPVPRGAPLVFGDNKDGVFGLRVPDSMAVNPAVKPQVAGTGHILNSNGLKDGAVWGKPADWVDYWGPIDGETFGVAIFDSPENFRHPQTWHARDYGLFTVNPFALHDFNLGPKGAGDYTVPTLGMLSVKYRVYFHRGDPTEADVAGLYKKFAIDEVWRVEHHGPDHN